MNLTLQADFGNAERALASLPGVVGTQIRGSALLAAANVVAKQAKTTIAFKDQSGKLRRSIRARFTTGNVVNPSGGIRKVKNAGARVQAGSRGARQAHLIELGHGGPKPAPPHPFIGPAYSQTTSTQLSVGSQVMRKNFEVAAAAIRRGDRGFTTVV